MTERINRETRLEYARFDSSIANADNLSSRGAKWVRVWIYCLNMKDAEAAEMIRRRNMTSDECFNGGHEDCHFLWCRCPHHSAVQFKLEHPQIPLHRRFAEEDESEAA